jgi:TPR repeat protein
MGRAPDRTKPWAIALVAAAALIFVATIVVDHVPTPGLLSAPREPVVASPARAPATKTAPGASLASSDSVLILPPLEPVVWRRALDQLPSSPLAVTPAPPQPTLAPLYSNEPILESPRTVASNAHVQSAFQVAQASTNPENDKPSPSLLVTYGNEYLSRSDVTAARLLYRRAADGGNANGAAALAATYDPVFLEQRATLRGVRPDPEQALRWYRVAMKLGDPSATTRVSALIDWLQSAALRGDEKARALLDRTSR